VNVVTLNLGSDPAGISSGIERAFRDDPGFRVQSFVTKINYIEYPAAQWDTKAVRKAWSEADVVHLHHNFRSADRIVRGGFLGGGMTNKPYVVEFHGTGYREDPKPNAYEVKKRGAIGLVSTLDLHLLDRSFEWLPSPVDVETLAPMRRPMNRLLICHAPTNRQVKSTALFLEAVERLQAEGYPVDLDLIEHRPWAECLERKAKADIFFDQVLLGYGNNALEAWAMGIPVIAGASDETLDEMERRFGHLPFYHATEETIYDALKELIESPELRQRYGQIGLNYVKTYHDYPVVREQLKAIYRKAAGVQEKAA
jgi:hypothetical protein